MLQNGGPPPSLFFGWIVQAKRAELGKVGWASAEAALCCKGRVAVGVSLWTAFRTPSPTHTSASSVARPSLARCPRT